MELAALLDPEQASRYLEWADANREAIAGLSLGGEGGGRGVRGERRGEEGNGAGSRGGGRRESGGKEGGKISRFHFFSSAENPFVTKKKFVLSSSVSPLFGSGSGGLK